ncbi:MAG TPA: hypothetical protein VJX23_01145 [Candidatus Binataceae bacterium]|nr:hypothetical protein [Candidatus Binataceae bacterium]
MGQPRAAVAGLILAAALLSIAQLASATAAPPAAVPTAAPPAQSLTLLPPPSHGQPVNIGVGIHIINIASIDEVKEQFEIDGYLIGKWVDSRLRYVPAGPGDEERDFQRDQIWIPYFEMVNAVTPRERYDTSIRVAPDGSVTYLERFHVVLSSRFALRRFPFDSQSLLIIIHPFVRQLSRITYSLFDHHIWTAREFNQYSSLAQWDFEAVEPYIGSDVLYNGVSVAEARFTIKVKRRSNFYVWKVILPLTLMVLLSWSVFWVEARDLSNQVQIAVTTILTVIAFAFAISASMPRVPYLTYIDAFFLTCYVFVFLAIVELMSVHLAHRREGTTDLGIRIQRMCRWFVPVSFLVTNVILIVHFLA